MNPTFRYIKSKPDPRDYIYSKVFTVDPAQLPSRFILNDTASYDKQIIGDCGGESGRSAYDIYLQGTVDVSPDFLYEEAKKIDGMPNVEGTSPKAIVSTMKNVGVCERPFYPTITDFHSLPVPSPDAYTSAAKYKISQYAKIQSLDELKHAIVSGNPVLTAVVCCDNFVHCENGFIDTPFGTLLGGHLLISKGFDDNLEHTFANGVTRKGFVRCKNSWGPDWGDKGDCWIAYDFFNFYLQDQMQYAVMEMWTITPAFSVAIPKNVIKLTVGNTVATLNGNPVNIEPPVNSNGHVMVPIRFVAESLGVNVDYNSDSGEITITQY